MLSVSFSLIARCKKFLPTLSNCSAVVGSLSKIRSAAFVFFTLKNMHKYKNQIFLNTTFNLVKR